MGSKNTKLIHEVFGRRPVASFDPDTSWPLAQELIGVEIEIEDPDGAPNLSPYWSTHHDGSLRNGVEYILAAPTGGRQLTEAINQFFDSGLRYSVSPRTSIHIHLNASDNLTIDQFRNMFVMMYLIEPAIFRWTDENRKWCGYCSPLTDLAPARIINILNDDPRDQGRFITAVAGEGNNDRYYGFNVAAFHRHGTVEFRYFPCTTDRDKVFDWIRFCMYVKKAARAFGSPEDILAVITNESSLTGFINQNFGTVAQNVSRNLDVEDCLNRVKDMRTMVNVPPSSLRTMDSYYRSVRSRGMNRYLQKNFPGAIAQDSVPAVTTTASEQLEAFYTRALPMDRGMNPSARTRLEEVRDRVTRAEAIYRDASTRYVNDPNSYSRLARSRARDDLVRAQLELQQLTDPNGI